MITNMPKIPEGRREVKLVRGATINQKSCKVGDVLSVVNEPSTKKEITFKEAQGLVISNKAIFLDGAVNTSPNRDADFLKDMSTRKVEDIVAYLPNASNDELLNALEVEKEGKNRTTAIEAINEEIGKR